MPSRIVREDILTSDPVNSLSWGAEVFYRRLMSKVDDYGRYVADLRILRASMYSLQLSKVVESDIGKWMLETTEAGLVRVYVDSGKKYLEILKFQQQRRTTSKYPPPPENESGSQPSAKHLIANDINCSQMLANAHLDGDEVGVVSEDEVEKEEENPLTPLKGGVASQRANSRAGTPPSLEDLVLFCTELGLPRTDAEYYDDHWKANGYRIGNNRVKDWKAVIRNHKRHGWLPSQKSKSATSNSKKKYLL